MSTWIGRILMLAVVGFIAYQLYMHRAVTEPGVETKSDSKMVTGVSRYSACMGAAERANNVLQAGARPFLRPPVDSATWSAAERRILDAVSDGEGLCSGGITEGERYAITEVQGALQAMKRSVAELNRAAQAEGGGDLVRFQEEIDGHLNRARAAMR